MRLMVPYFIFSVLKCVLESKDPFLMLVNPDGFLWFLWDLFWISVFFNAIVVAFSPNEMRIFVVIFVISLIALGAGKFLPSNDFEMKSICWMFHFYVAGAALKAFVHNYESFWYSTILGLIMLAVFLLLVYLRFVFIGTESLVSSIVSMLNAYIGCWSFFVLFRRWMDKPGILVLLGQSTLGIYAIHQMLYGLLGVHDVWLSFFVVLAISWLFVLFVRRTKYLKFVIGE